ncbi:MAG: sigma factor-like helix-turn-helix DNA-binding protein [Bacteroidota bacterium]
MTKKLKMHTDTPYPDPRVNLPKLLPAAIKKVLDESKKSDLFTILNYRMGLTSSQTRTLAEIGGVLGITRERVRQKEEAAIQELENRLLDIPLMTVSIEVDLLREIKVLKAILTNKSLFLLDSEAKSVISDRYDHDLSEQEKTYLHLLMRVYGFTKVKISGYYLFWIAGQTTVTVGNLRLLKRQCEEILQDERISISYFDLLFKLASLRDTKLPDEQVIRFVLQANEVIETLEDEYYQIRFEELRAAQKYAFRVLWESNPNIDQAGKPLHSDEIARGINSRLVAAGKRRLTRATIVNSMTREPERFETVGKSGLWGLAQWEIESADAIALMVKCFYKINRPASASEIYECVKSSRPDIPPNSISTYLSDRDEFVRVDRGIYQPREWKLNAEQKKNRKLLVDNKDVWSLQDYADAIEDIFNQAKLVEMPLSELRDQLVQVSGRSVGRVDALLREIPIIRTEHIENGPSKKAILLEDYQLPDQTRTYLRQQLPKEVLKILSEKSSRSMPLVDLRDIITENSL